jgi:calcineurin-like phosphoesterase family protein
MKLRELLKGGKAWVVKHDSCVCTLLATTAVMLSIMFWQSTSHITDEIIMIKKHSIELAEMDRVLMERNNVIVLQAETIKKYGDYLQKATSYIQKQEEVIKKLIDELNRLNRNDLIAGTN